MIARPHSIFARLRFTHNYVRFQQARSLSANFTTSSALLRYTRQRRSIPTTQDRYLSIKSLAAEAQATDTWQHINLAGKDHSVIRD